MKGIKRLLSQLHEDGLIVPLFLAAFIALLTIWVALLIVVDDSDLWLNLTAEFVGLLLGGLVVAFLFEQLLERRQIRQSDQIQQLLEERQRRQSEQARHEILEQVRNEIIEVAVIARLYWRMGLQLDPIDEKLRASEALALFGKQLATARFDKYNWRFDADREDIPTGAEDAIREYVNAAEKVAFTVKHVVPPMKAYLPVAATTGEYDLLRMLLALLEADTIFRYLEGRSAWESKTALAMIAQKQITDFLSTGSELFALIEEELGPQESPFLEEAYREQLERFAKYGL